MMYAMAQWESSSIGIARSMELLGPCNRTASISAVRFVWQLPTCFSAELVSNN